MPIKRITPATATGPRPVPRKDLKESRIKGGWNDVYSHLCRSCCSRYNVNFYACERLAYDERATLNCCISRCPNKAAYIVPVEKR